MKKILVFSFLLGIGSLSYSNVSSSGNNEATMDITATIIKPLTVQSNGPLNFGSLLPGVIGTARSSFTLSGEENARVKITFDGLEAQEDNFEIPITSTSNSDSSFMVYFNCTDDSGKKINQGNKFVYLKSNGKLNLHIAASATPETDQAPGNYTGSIKMRAIYE